MRIRNIKELAELAQVSTGTVSRALAGSELISKTTRERIQALASEHGFRPNVMARNLRIQRTGAIGVLIPLGHAAGRRLSDPFFMAMLGLLGDGLAVHGYDLLLSRVVPEDENWLHHFITSGRVDGVIVIGQSNQSATLDRVAANYRPLVVWGGHVPGQVHCSVGTDNQRGGYMAARHLTERGCKRIDFFGDPVPLEMRQRLEGCRAAMAEAGLAGQLHVLPTHLIAPLALLDIARYLNGATSQPDGVVAASDVIAVSALRAFAEHGLSVPGDVRVIGYDGLTLGEFTSPSLSTLAQDLEQGAGHLVDMLVRRIAREETQSVVMEPELVVRMSS